MKEKKDLSVKEGQVYKVIHPFLDTRNEFFDELRDGNVMDYSAFRATRIFISLVQLEEDEIYAFSEGEVLMINKISFDANYQEFFVSVDLIRSHRITKTLLFSLASLNIWIGEGFIEKIK